MFSIRVVSLDYYISKPIEELYASEEFNLGKEWQEPVIRIFGATNDGIKSCVHVHGVYPYMFVPCKGGENPERDALLLGAALDEALKSSLNSKTIRFVHKVTLVSGIPLYGYHSKHRQFFKIYFYNPYHIKKGSELLLSGAILGQKFQPHESHIPYTLQFMMDYNIYGMSFVTFSKIKYRKNVENPDLMMGIKESEIFSNKVKKMSCSRFEADALAGDIANRIWRKTIGENPGLRAIWKDEQDRRRRQNKVSQMTVPQSLSRPDGDLGPAELMYKERLAARLREVPFEGSGSGGRFVYPAEAAEDGSLLEASALEDGIERPAAAGDGLDVSSLVDETILSQVGGASNEMAGARSEEEEEGDSVLGRNPTEEEAELEDEEGMDMTQPLDVEEDEFGESEGEPGTRESGNVEEAFWRNMADRIGQLDGGQESSSDSDGDAVPSASEGGFEFPSTWSGSIMSILSEDSGCPTPSTICQTPRTFWSNYSPNWAPQNQDSWDWNKHDIDLPDVARKDQPETIPRFEFPFGSEESYVHLFNSDGGERFQMSATDPPGVEHPASRNLSAVPSTDHANATFGQTVDDVSGCEKTEVSSQKKTVLENKIAGKTESDRQKFLQVLKSFAGKKFVSEDRAAHLTLKQYIKDCKEIVSVDFKTLCNQEMIVIEYKSQSKRSLENKYLIKPLEKFLEKWNSAERRANDGLPKELVNPDDDIEGGKKLRSVLNLLEGKFRDTSSVESSSNAMTMKSMEILPSDYGSCLSRCYNVNENVISQGKIKMKLIKSRRENLEQKLVGETLQLRNESKRNRSVRNMETINRKGMGKAEGNAKGRRKNEVERKKMEKWKSFSESDTKLINEINSSFEEYFESLVKRKTSFRKRKRNVREEEEEEEEDWGEERREASDEEGPMGPSTRARLSSAADPVEFASRFLSTFSRMPDVPPLSITITLGNPLTCAPVQMNFQPTTTLSRRESKRSNKKQRRKMRIENVDGPADEDSDSEESADEDLKGKCEGQMKAKTKKEGYYKPLDVVIHGATSKEKGGGRKKKGSPEVEGKRREESSSRSLRSGKKEKIEIENLMKTSYPVLKVDFDSNQEPDFIDDSDEERRRKGSKSMRRGRKWSRANPKAFAKRRYKATIPQADTEAFTSSEDERLSGKGEGEAEVTSLSLQAIAGRLRNSESSNPEPPCSQENAPPLLVMPPLTMSGEPLFPRGAESESLPMTPVFSKSLLEETRGNSRSSESAGNCSREVRTPSVSTGERENPALSHLIGCKTIRPKEKCSTRSEVAKSMKDHGLLESEEKAPFYSNRLDVTKAVEAGPRVLKIENRSAGGLKLYKSSLEIVGAEEKRNALLKGKKIERFRLVGDKESALTTLRRPPSSKEVTRWLSCREDSSEKKGKEIEKVKVKVKLIKAVSSSEEETGFDEEMELSLSRSSLSVESKPESCIRGVEHSVEPETNSDSKNGAPSHSRAGERCIPTKKLEAILEEGRSVDSSGSPVRVPGLNPSPSPKESRKSTENSFQIRGVTLDNTFGFRHSVEDMRCQSSVYEYQYVGMLAIEIHVQTRKDFRPDPAYDPIRALFYVATFDSPTQTQENGAIVVGEPRGSEAEISGLSVHCVPTERALIEKLLELMKEWDPDILAGYEIEMHSWGYLVQRGFVLEMNIVLLLGRVLVEDLRKRPGSESHNEDDESGVPKSVRHMKVSGRIVLDVWRVLRHEIALTSYTFENVMYHVCHERVPLFSHEKLSFYWEHPGKSLRHVAVEHYARRVRGVVEILDRLDFVGRTSELSRLFGIQFYEVLSRGSQFRVESMMLRLAKPMNYVPTSPSVAQRAAMRAPASLPLILEPESLFYSDPVIVLDFQSLYPSIIIAYNYCFSTCLGRVENLGSREPFEFGCTQLHVSPEELKRLESDLSISPAGIAFVKSNVRKGVLPAMLEQILETRLMVKRSMKDNKNDKTLQKVLYSRQLGLKLIANVTYGYTAANFSGRMPCIEVGDSVVSKGRETLHRAIQLIKNTPQWGARVVYGDTDSIFVLTPGRSREEAFRIGAEIAEAVTRDNPKPVKLKLEKVYQPSILQTKKRYVGYMYESPEQERPTFEAKGIETVRRDGCPAAAKILEKALRILFETRDVSLVKKYTVSQFAKLFRGSVNPHELIFAKEYRGRKGYRPSACVPALHLAKQWTRRDRRAEPRVKERVPYVVVNGPPGTPLIRLVRSPEDLLSEPGLRINAVYYITKAVIPPMQRCFSLLGADVMSWYADMPRKYKRAYKLVAGEGQKRGTISQFFAPADCIVCSGLANGPVCPGCERSPRTLALSLSEKIRRLERCYDGISEICRCCWGRPAEPDCISLDCPVLYRKNHAQRALEQTPALREILTRYL